MVKMSSTDSEDYVYIIHQKKKIAMLFPILYTDRVLFVQNRIKITRKMYYLMTDRRENAY